MAKDRHSIIPKPTKIEYGNETFIINGNTVIQCDKETEKIGIFFAERISDSTGINLPVSVTERIETPGNAISFHLTDDKETGDEGYKLEVTEKSITASAVKPAGIFYAVQTLMQLLPVEVYSPVKKENIKLEVPAVTITDKPRFGWRGMHLDVARHYMPVKFIKKFIDLLAMHKMNIFHWHLTEDQGWRIEIKKYPKLTEVGAWRKETVVGHNKKDENGNFIYDGIPHGGFYTQDEIRDIVKYAEERFITIVPEIDMPGHMQAAIAAYPELGCTGKQLEVGGRWGVIEDILNPEDATVEFMQNVLTEVMDLFPGEFIHIGGDEAPKKQWEKSERIQQLRKERGLKDMHEMQSWFIKQMDTFLTEKGRRLIGWDEILEGGLAPGAAVMSWRGEAGGISAAKLNHDVVMASNPYTYFDYYQGDKETEPLAIGGDLRLEKVYTFDPVPTELSEEESKYVLGGQGQLWTEYMKTSDYVEYMTYPRATALAEVLWNHNKKEDYDKFLERLKTQLKRFDIIGVNYRKLNK